MGKNVTGHQPHGSGPGRGRKQRGEYPLGLSYLGELRVLGHGLWSGKGTEVTQVTSTASPSHYLRVSGAAGAAGASGLPRTINLIFFFH